MKHPYKFGKVIGLDTMLKNIANTPRNVFKCLQKKFPDLVLQNHILGSFACIVSHVTITKKNNNLKTSYH